MSSYSLHVVSFSFRYAPHIHKISLVSLSRECHTWMLSSIVSNSKSFITATRLFSKSSSLSDSQTYERSLLWKLGLVKNFTSTFFRNFLGMCHIQKPLRFPSRTCFIMIIISRSGLVIIVLGCYPPTAPKNFGNNQTNDSTLLLLRRTTPKSSSAHDDSPGWTVQISYGTSLFHILYQTHYITEKAIISSSNWVRPEIHVSSYYRHPSHKKIEGWVHFLFS